MLSSASANPGRCGWGLALCRNGCWRSALPLDIGRGQHTPPPNCFATLKCFWRDSRGTAMSRFAGSILFMETFQPICMGLPGRVHWDEFMTSAPPPPFTYLTSTASTCQKNRKACFRYKTEQGAGRHWTIVRGIRGDFFPSSFLPFLFFLPPRFWPGLSDLRAAFKIRNLLRLPNPIKSFLLYPVPPR